MSEILFQYHKVNPTTWVYLSSLLTIGLFFKFSRVWSVRNVDLLGLIMLAPGLLLDPMMVRRPLLEPNLSVGGMTFIGVFMLLFLMANVVNSKLTSDDLAG